MGNFLHELGLGYLMENLDTASGFLGHVLKEGKAIHNYYGLPYINQHFGSTQIVCRVNHNPEGESLQFAGFDAHADSLCVWNLRLEKKMENTDEDDPTSVKILAHDMDGHNMLAINVVNGDVLPSFKKDEVIQLQMVAFSANARLFEDEEAYVASVEPGPNGRKLMMGENTVFPVGMFSKDDEMKDVVRIHGTINRANFGRSKLGEDEIGRNIRCHVDTQLGEIVVILVLDDIENAKEFKTIHEGMVIDCAARLSGDAAIYDYENGIVRNAENNLKLVAYSLENGDPERLRPVLAKGFVYHSENSGKHFEDVDEFIGFTRMVNTEGDPSRTYYATITEIEEGPELEYPVGTRCAVISYESEEGYNSIIFVDTDEDGDIKRIYLSREPRYRFCVDDPFPDDHEDLAEMIEKATYKTSIIGRSHFHDLIDSNTDEEEIDRYIADHRDELEADLADLFSQEIAEDVFAEAFLRGVRKSKVTDYREEDSRDIGKQFHKDATLFKSEEVQKETFHDALVLSAAIGQMYIGRADRKPDSENAEE